VARAPSGAARALVGPLALFVAAALVVVWQNARVAVLWDISYVLNTASRIAGGEVPYRDFPLPHAPGTFVVQALLVRLFDGPFSVQIVYAALLSGLAAVATFAIVRRLLAPCGPGAAFAALALSVPATVLGVYAVYPHPFYDPDCSALVLAAVLALLACERRGWPPLWSVLAGALVPLPLFFKQNTGGAFCALACATLALSALAGARGALWALAGAAGALGVLLALLHATAGLGAAYHWTFRYAASRRLGVSPLAQVFAFYRDPLAYVALGAAVAAALVLRRTKHTIPATALLLVPFFPIAGALVAWLVPAIRPAFATLVFRWNPFGVWPATVVLALASVLVRLRHVRPRLDVLLPFVLAGVVHAAFLSQGAIGSSYALWPVLILLVAGIAAAVAEADPVRGPRVATGVAMAVGTVLAVFGVFQVTTEARLVYAKVLEQPIARARSPRLLGMATGGSYLPDLDALLAFCAREIPPDEPLLQLPGEDPLYFALGRRPPLPVAQYDATLNPYDADELAAQVRARGVAWIVVKERLQVYGAPFREQAVLLQKLAPAFAEHARVGPYRILRRRTP